MKKCCQDYLDEQFGDPDVAGEIYEEYMRSIDEKLAELDAALANTDWKRLDRAAHTIKGNALATGDREMADTAIELRGAAALSNLAGAKSLAAKLHSLADTP